MHSILRSSYSYRPILDWMWGKNERSQSSVLALMKKQVKYHVAIPTDSDCVKFDRLKMTQSCNKESWDCFIALSNTWKVNHIKDNNIKNVANLLETPLCSRVSDEAVAWIETLQ